MMFRTPIRVLLMAFGLAGVCVAQSAPKQEPAAAPCPAANPNGSNSTSKTCTPPAAGGQQPSAAQQFPFPGEASQPSTPAAPAPAASHPSAASDHPYPGDPDASSSSSSSSSSSDDGNAPVGPPASDASRSTRRKLPKVAKVQTDDERVDEDLRVAKFYIADDDLPGAYLRAKDAVKIQPDYSEGHFMLAEVAQKMKKKQEAVAEYQAYLKMDPQGQRTKAAQRALEELNK